jgi:hypothetical protein
MGSHVNPSLIRENLVFYLDPENDKTVLSNTHYNDLINNISLSSFTPTLCSGGVGFRTNYIPNSLGVGPGEDWVPTDWGPESLSNAGLNVNVIDRNILSDTPYVDIRIAGTPFRGDITVYFFFTQTGSTVLINEEWVSSCFLQILEDLSATSPDIRLLTYAGTTPDFGPPASQIQTSEQINNIEFKRYESSLTIADNVVNNKVFTGLSIGNITTDQSIDITVRVSRPQLEQGTVATPFIPTSIGPVTVRDQDPSGFLRLYEDTYITDDENEIKSIFDQDDNTILLWVKNRDDNTTYDKPVSFFGQNAIVSDIASFLTLTGADSEIKGVDGFYTSFGTMGNRQKFKHIDRNITIFWSDDLLSWNITQADNINKPYYRSFENVSSPWKVNSWVPSLSSAVVTVNTPTLSVFNQNNIFRFIRFDGANNKVFETVSTTLDRINNSGIVYNTTVLNHFYFLPTITATDPWDVTSWTSNVSSLSTYSESGHPLAKNYITLNRQTDSNWVVNSHGLKQIYREESYFKDSGRSTSVHTIRHRSYPRSFDVRGNTIVLGQNAWPGNNLSTTINGQYTQTSVDLDTFQKNPDFFTKFNNYWVIRRGNVTTGPIWYTADQQERWPWEVSSWSTSVTGWSAKSVTSNTILDGTFFSDGRFTGSITLGFNPQTGRWNYKSVDNTKRVTYKEVAPPATSFYFDLNYPPLDEKIFVITDTILNSANTYRYTTPFNTFYDVVRESGTWSIRSSGFKIYSSVDPGRPVPFDVENWATTVTALSVLQPLIINQPSFSRDFALNRTLNHGDGPDITFQRETLATFYDEEGLLRNTPHNILRNSEARESITGILPDSTSAPTASGRLPKYWIFFRNTALNIDAGVLAEVLDTGNEGGLNYIDIRFHGTPSRTENRFLGWAAPASNDPFPLTSNSTLVAKGQTWTNSVYMKLQNGSLANTNIDTVIYGRDFNNENIGGEITITRNNPGTGSLTDQRYFTTRTLTQSAVYNLYTGFRFSITEGLPIDFTLRIAAPQVEQNITPSVYVPSIYNPTANQTSSFFRTNELLSSNIFNADVWDRVGVKPEYPDLDLVSDYLGSAWKVALSSATFTNIGTLSSGGFQQNLPAQPPGTQVTNSIYIRRDITDIGTTLPDVVFGISDSDNITIPSWRITWYLQRFFYTGTLTNPGGLYLKYYNTDTTPTSSVLYFANAQSEFNSGPTPYVNTVDSRGEIPVLVYNQRTNLLKQSNNFGDSIWYGYFGKAPELSKNATDPFGNLNGAWSIPLSAARYGSDPSNPSRIINYHTGLIQAIDILPVGTPITVSAWLKADDNSARYQFGMNDCNQNYVYLTNEWQRVSYTSYYPVEGTCTGPRGLQFVVLSGTSTNNSSRVYLYGMQCEIGHNVTPYIPTTTTPVSSDITYLPNISQPRFDHDHTGNSLGLLIEEPTTNYMPYSEDFTNLFWGKENITVSPNTALAPDGTYTASEINETASSGYHVLKASPFIYGTNNWTSVSIFAKVKLNGRTKFSIQIGSLESAIFDLTAATATAGSGATANIISVGKGWYRCTVTRYSATNANVFYLLRDDSSNPIYMGDPTKGMYFWGAQEERSDYKPGYLNGYHERRISSSYIGRHGYMGGNRAQEYATVAPADFKGTDQGTLYTNFKTGNYVGGVATIASLGGQFDPIPNRIGSFITGLQVAVNNTYNTVQSITPTRNTEYKSIIGYQNNNNAASVNGSSVTTLVTSVPANLYRLFIGGESFQGSGAANSHIKEITYWPVRLNNCQLKYLTDSVIPFEASEFLLSDGTTRTYNDKPYWEEDSSWRENAKKLRIIFAGDPTPSTTLWGGIPTGWYYGEYDASSSNPSNINLTFSASNPDAANPWDVEEWLSIEDCTILQPPTAVPIVLTPPTPSDSIRFRGLTGWAIEYEVTSNLAVTAVDEYKDEQFPWNVTQWVNKESINPQIINIEESGVIKEILSITKNPEISAWEWLFNGSNTNIAYSAASIEQFPWDVEHSLWEVTNAYSASLGPTPPKIAKPPLVDPPISIVPLGDSSYLNDNFAILPYNGGSLLKNSDGLLGFKTEKGPPRFSTVLGPLNTETDWYMVGLSISGNQIKLYKDLNVHTFFESSGVFGLSGITIGTSNIDVGQVLIYSRPIDDTEILKNYKWFKGRYKKDYQPVGPVSVRAIN